MSVQTAASALVTCPSCTAQLPGVFVPHVLDVDDIVTHFGGKIDRRTVLEWFRRGLLRGFKPEGTREWMILADDYVKDLERMKRSSAGPRAIRQRTLAQGGTP